MAAHEYYVGRGRIIVRGLHIVRKDNDFGHTYGGEILCRPWYQHSVLSSMANSTGLKTYLVALDLSDFLLDLLGCSNGRAVYGLSSFDIAGRTEGKGYARGHGRPAPCLHLANIGLWWADGYEQWDVEDEKDDIWSRQEA